MASHKKAQQGFMVILAMIFIFVMGIMGIIIAYMFFGQAMITAAVYQGKSAFYIAESGLEAATRYITRPSLNSAPTRIACGAVTGSGQLTTATMGIGQFTVTASKNGVTTSTLTSAITAGATSITVSNAAGFSAQGRVMIDREAIEYAAKSGNTLVGVTRGADQTQASAHANATTVSQFQCNIASTGAVPTIASGKYQRDLSMGVQLQDGWIVGNRNGNDYRIYRWNGGTELSWTNSFLAAGSDREHLRAVSQSSYSDAWAVGNERSNNFVILDWNGAAWSKSLVAGACNNQDLYGVSTVSRNEAWAVGRRYQPGCSGGQRRYTVMHYDGTNWNLLSPSTSPSIPSDSNSNRDLYAVHVIDTNGDAAGNIGFAVGDQGQVLRYNGTNWVSDSSGTNRDLQSVYVVSGSEAWAVGNNGTIIRWNGTSWSGFSSPVGTRMNAVSMLDTDGDGLAEFGVAVGQNGRILQYNGSTWSSVANGGSNLNAVYVLATNDVWATGNGGRISHYDGSNWTTSTLASTLRGITFTAPRFDKTTGWKQTFN